MRKFTFFIFRLFLFVLFSNLLFSQILDSLTEEQKKEYNRKRISIEVIGHTTMNREPFFGTYEATTTRKWNAYQGFNTIISEEQFFSITGYKDEALKAKLYKEKGKNMLIGGLLASVIGTVMMLYTTEEEVYDSYLDFTYTEVKMPLFYPGLIISSVGLGVGYAGFTLQSSNWAPYSTVRDISEEYNKQLILYLYKNF